VIPRFGREDLPGLLRRHGLFLFPSPAEGCSLALLEAMAGGLAPVTTRTGYASDLIETGQNGILLEAGDIAGFAAAVQTAADDPEAILRMGWSARQSIAGHSWRDRASERVRIWEALLGEAK
jgi:glycosyltransferase involved in cell wall biosynthesis